MRKRKLASRGRALPIGNDRPYLLVLLLQGELLLLHLFQLIAEVEFSGLLLELGELILVFRHLLQGWFHAENERASRIKICALLGKFSECVSY